MSTHRGTIGVNGRTFGLDLVSLRKSKIGRKEIIVVMLGHGERGEWGDALMAEVLIRVHYQYLSLFATPVIGPITIRKPYPYLRFGCNFQL